jgi:stalled ribosome rescue protein Dom34
MKRKGDQRDKQFTGHLRTYYDEVISCIRDAESILIFGPGEPKAELKKRIESKKLHGRIVGIETVDNMTDGQIASKVRQYFLNLK